ncbi:hypothetical protein ACFC1R_28160 [Kitasatospora sp. NPDC056138]|uniref:hypothetical protein n=1 Tax=Kitasatospora sp. NPDC056138 TaxID=3345724 RepID=UPI0035DAE6E0
MALGEGIRFWANPLPSTGGRAQDREVLRICFTDQDLALTRIAPAADMSFELSLSLHLLATRRPESRLGKWHEQLGQYWKPRSEMLFDLFSASDIPEFDAGSITAAAVAPCTVRAATRLPAV